MLLNWTTRLKAAMQRSLEVFSVPFVFLFCAGILLGPMSAVVIIYLLIAGNIYWKIVCALYVAFYCYDIRSSEYGGRGAGVSWIRGLYIFKCFMNYFPIDLVKTVDLPPDRNYLVCIFPHGGVSIGATGNFCTSHSKWSTFFPGIRSKLTSLPANFLSPVSREIVLSCGMASASANSLTTMLKQSNDPAHKLNSDGYTSTAVGLIVGGVREQKFTRPDTYKLVIAKRRGFVRIALQTGASLVPAISFGENNIRIIPRRHPITTVIGAPIDLKIISNPNNEELDEIHGLFCTRLSELFETHKRPTTFRVVGPSCFLFNEFKKY